MKIVRIVCGLCLLLAGLLVVCQPATALAQNENEDEVEERIDLVCSFPKVEATAAMDSSFNITLRYFGSEPRYFDFNVAAPEGWSVYTSEVPPTGARILGRMLDPRKTYGETISVHVDLPNWPLAEPGEYNIIFEAGSEDIRGSVELTRIVVPGYILELVPITDGVVGKYSTSATAGRDNYFSVEVRNPGTTTIDNISLTCPKKPAGWAVEFSPDKLDFLPAFSLQTIEVNVKPPPKTIAGDYFPITISALGEQTSESFDLRVTVEIATIWGGVSIGIILLVIAGLVFVFMRFSRR